MSQELIKLGRKRAAELGLDIQLDWYKADDIHKLLGESIELGMYRTDQELGFDRWKGDQYSNGRRTHNAFAVGIRPIHKETREDKLESIVKRLAEYIPNKQQCEMWDLHKEAKQLLSERDT